VFLGLDAETSLTPTDQAVATQISQ
jgi:hypothetical protein